jgi:dipeptidyl aminopeptidase/acylaminoacyl peptidase
MLALILCILAAPTEDLALLLRHLDATGSAEAPAPSPDGTRVAFVTTLFGSRQAASIPVEGGYPAQLTDEPGGVVAVRWSPTDARILIATALRGETHRLLLLEEETGATTELDPAPGDQLLGGFTRDGKKILYAVVDAGRVVLKQLPLDTRKPSEVAPPPPAAGAAVAPLASLPIDAALAGLTQLTSPSPDGRSIVGQIRRGDDETLVLVDLATARGEPLTPHEGKAHFRSPRWSGDGKSLYVLTDQGRGTQGVDVITIASRTRKPLWAPQQRVEAYAVSDDNHHLAIAADQSGETIFSLLELPSLRAQPLPQPAAGVLAQALSASEPPLVWSRGGDRLLFGWRQSDDTTDLWMFRTGYGTATRLTRSPRPGLPRSAIPRPRLVRAAGDPGELQGWLWMPPAAERPRVAVLVSTEAVRPAFDKRIAALNFAGIAVLSLNAPREEAEAAALRYLKNSPQLDPAKPLLIDLEAAAPVVDPAAWSGAVIGKDSRRHHGLPTQTHELTDDLHALVDFARERQR